MFGRILVILDWISAYGLGRPICIHNAEYVLCCHRDSRAYLEVSIDVSLPVECDDEYWVASDAGPAFKQPPGRPSKIAFFNCFVRLHQILAFAMRTIVRRSELSLVGRMLTPSCLVCAHSIRSTSPSKPLATSARSGNSAPWRNWTRR